MDCPFLFISFWKTGNHPAGGYCNDGDIFIRYLSAECYVHSAHVLSHAKYCYAVILFSVYGDFGCVPGRCPRRILFEPLFRKVVLPQRVYCRVDRMSNIVTIHKLSARGGLYAVVIPRVPTTVYFAFYDSVMPPDLPSLPDSWAQRVGKLFYSSSCMCTGWL